MPAGRRRDLYLLSGDDALLLELGPILGERYRTRPIDSADQLEGVAASPWLLLIDATARPDARAQAARIEQQHPQAPLIIVCADGKSAEWSSQLARGMISAVVERGALAGGALSEALTAADLRLKAAATASTSNALGGLALSSPPPARRGARLTLTALAVAAVAAGAWYFMFAHGAKPTPPMPVTGGATPAAPTTASGVASASGPAAGPAAEAGTPAPTAEKAPVAAPRPVLELLSDARVAFRDEKNLLPRTDAPPRGDSALELYAQVLAQDPQNEEARDGLRRLFSVARARIQADLAAGRLDDASRLLAAFRDVGIAGDATARLEADIAAARPRWLVAQARAALASGDTDTANQLIAQIAAGGGDRAVLADLRRALEARTTDGQLADLAGKARAAMAAGALLEPAADSARARLQAMQQLNRNHPQTLAVQRELQAALLARALSAAHAGQFDPAQQFVTVAADYGNGAEVTNARRQIQSDMEAAHERASAAAAAQARDSSPKPAPALAADATEPAYIRARPTTPLAATYPPQALQAGVKGYVIVEFTLNVKGQASEPTVIEADPPRVFDSAALAAVRRGRFDTTDLGAAGKPRRARLRISFK